MNTAQDLSRRNSSTDVESSPPESVVRLRVAGVLVIDQLVPCDQGGELGDCATHVERASMHGYADGYDPETELIPPISLRASIMELLWVCGDCGEHYPRAQSCPDRCNCGAPRQHFYAPTED